MRPSQFGLFFAVLTAFGVALAACVAPHDSAASVSSSDLASSLVGEWSSARRSDVSSGGETIIFARDRSVVLRDGNYLIQTSSPVPAGGTLTYEVDESEQPVRLDLVVTNAAGEQVARIPGIVKALTDDQVQVCMDPATLNRPEDFNGPNCAVLTKLVGQPGEAVERPVPAPIYVQQPTYAEPSGVYVDSPGDGFLAMRSEPTVQRGYRVRQIPHGAAVQLGSCGASTSVGSTGGRWCEVSYDGQSGYAFDAWLVQR